MISGEEFQITPETKVGELIENYPHLEEILISLAPPFKNLRNPLLKKTVAKITSLRQAAIVGNISISHLINELRKSAGYEHVCTEETVCKEEHFSIVEDQIAFIYDARKDLDNGVVPAVKVMKDLKEIKSGEIYKLITPFLPAPLIDKAKEKGFLANCKQISSSCFETYFRAA